MIGPAFTVAEVPDVVEALIDAYRAQRTGGERFIDTFHRGGVDPFKQAANAARHAVEEKAVAA